MRLSEHFTLTEAMRSQVARRSGIDNTPGLQARENLELVAATVLEPPRVHFGIAFSPSSWFRCLELEAELCRRTIRRLLESGRIATAEEYLEKKQHPKGEAVDFEIPGIPNLVLATWLRDNLEAFDQLILEFCDPEDPAGGWVHASRSGDGRDRRQVLTFDGRTYTAGLPSL